MKRTLSFILSVLLCSTLMAQEKLTSEKIQQDMLEAKEKLEAFDTETLLDSLDQEKLPKLVSGGLFAGANISNFIITRNHKPMSSNMKIGGELGGFIDFRITRHFSIQPQVIFTAQQNYFAATDTANTLWSFGAEIPVYFLGRFGNMQKGYIQFGGGIFTHFTFASNIKDKYKNWADPTSVKPSTDPYDYSKLYSLHDNHFGAFVTSHIPDTRRILSKYRDGLNLVRSSLYDAAMDDAFAPWGGTLIPCYSGSQSNYGPYYIQGDDILGYGMSTAGLYSFDGRLDTDWERHPKDLISTNDLQRFMATLVSLFGEDASDAERARNRPRQASRYR